MLRFLKTKAEVATDVTTTVEVQEVSEATEIRVVNAEAVVSDQNVMADSAAKEVQTDQEEKADAENRVRFKEKIERQDVLKVLIDRPDARLKRQKTVSQEEASILRISYYNKQLRFALVRRSFLIISH